MKDQSLKRPTRRSVSLQSIETRPDAFQFRHSDTYEHHVGELIKVLKNTGKLDELTLWEDAETGELVLVDGHHRLEAYRQQKWAKNVPAVVHRCTLDEARLLALAENTKIRLPLTNGERADVAWKLVCLGETYSRQQTVKASGMSDGTIATMRRTRRQLLNAPDAGELPTSWHQAQRELKSQDDRSFSAEDWDEWIIAEADALDDIIGKPLGDMAHRRPQAACLVVVARLGSQGMRHLFEEHAAEYGYVLEEDMGMEEEPF
ncbi:ParB/RepB/Spo0J family partition protein [Roseobacter sp. YSTF-M11]|uniref:ParB/RepB/Spo0J family partition protein n=1 Tax=Roseobacter insulae TaxID=2859783 RepID=A0A9X1K0Y2_9RHOB|nr:ParB/RepB/Spo0J family partition protein [Roseobacter insulae]MBW4708674.1 ParB/RepB/Spo0J family partition protein [Roseobacter insulae]